jgi:protein tyrosine/serine phosphatase
MASLIFQTRTQRNLLISVFTICSAFLLSSCREVETQTAIEIDPGKVFRSGQLDPEALNKLILEKNIKTVINLRGEFPGQKWFDQEFLVTEQLNVALVSVNMILGSIPHRYSLLYLLESLRNAERPILIHCDTGIERTGEASAIYEMIYLRKSKDEAMKMLSKKFGYENGKSDPSKEYFINRLWVDETWANNDYDPCKTQYNYYDPTNIECTSRSRRTENNQPR